MNSQSITTQPINLLKSSVINNHSHQACNKTQVLKGGANIYCNKNCLQDFFLEGEIIVYMASYSNQESVGYASPGKFLRTPKMLLVASETAYTNEKKFTQTTIDEFSWGRNAITDRKSQGAPTSVFILCLVVISSHTNADEYIWHITP